MKKVLIITYYWPPAGGPAIQRVLKFVKYLPSFGWQPVILTVQNGEYPAIDNNFETDIPKECIVYKTPALEPISFYKKFIGLGNEEKIPTAVLAEKKQNWKKRIANWIRLNLFIPDAKIGWKYHATKKGNQIIQEHKPDLIFSSSPPPTVHLIAKYLAKKNDIKWVADFRDPWTDIYYYDSLKKSNFALYLDKKLESSVFNYDNLICTVSNSLAELFYYKYQRNDIEIIPNGFDTDDFKDFDNINRFEKFTIVYAGSLNSQQNPTNLWQALENLIETNKQFADDFQLLFMGNFSKEIIQSIHKHNLFSYFTNQGYVDHLQALKNLKRSHIKLLVIPNTRNNRGIITGKFFEYLAIGGFIVGIGPKDSDAAIILKGVGAGSFHNYDDDLTSTLLSQYSKWKNGEYDETNPEKLNKFSRKSLTQKLSNIFNDLT